MACNLELVFHQLLSRFHLGVSLGGTVAYEGEDAEEYEKGHDGEDEADVALLRELCPLVCYLCLFLLCLVDGGQLGGGVVLLRFDGRCYQRGNLCCYGQGGVLSTSLVIKLELGEKIGPDDFEIGLHIPFGCYAVKVLEDVGRLGIAANTTQIIARVNARLVGLRVFRLQEFLEILGRLLLFSLGK